MFLVFNMLFWVQTVILFRVIVLTSEKNKASYLCTCVWIRISLFVTNFETHIITLDILVKVTICYKHLNMFNFVIIAFTKYILHIILRSLVWKFSVLPSLALKMDKEYREGRWFGGGQWEVVMTFCLKNKKSALALLTGIFNADS